MPIVLALCVLIGGVAGISLVGLGLYCFGFEFPHADD